jgi:mRNA-degrading endonuclease toxin of MazEF toxin-antitoxin module
VLTRQEAIPVLKRVTVVTATTRVRGIPTELPLDEDDGMPQTCVLAFDSIRTVPKALLTERITRLPGPRQAELCEKLRVATGC